MALLRPQDYHVAWITPLQIETQAALHMLDQRHDGNFPMRRGDDYVFLAGEMCGHNIVIATLPAGQEYGTGSAAALASQVKRFFPNLWFGLLVGIAAGLPDLDRDPPRDIRLGDVLVGIPDMDSSGLVAYDLGRETETGRRELLRQGHILAQTEPVVRSAIGRIRLDWPDEAKLFLPYYEAMKTQAHQSGTFDDPGYVNDKLYHVSRDGSEQLVQRQERPESERTRVWYGSIGSGEKLVKTAAMRDQLREEHDIIGLEMEAAGTMNRIPVGVIRGVSDYADKHKNWDWQPYAAAMAAAYAKAVLSQIGPSQERSSSESSDRETSTGDRFNKRGIRRSTDVNGTARKKRRYSREPDETITSKSNVFRGQGNQNVGSGSISIGGGQHFH